MPVGAPRSDARDHLLQRPRFGLGRTPPPTTTLRDGARAEHFLRQRVGALKEQPCRRAGIIEDTDTVGLLRPRTRHLDEADAVSADERQYVLGDHLAGLRP